MWTDNPVMDTENHQDQPRICCGVCGGDIYTGDSLHFAEDHYEIGGVIFCEGCAKEWLEQRKVS